MEEQQGLGGIFANRRPDSSSSTPYESAACSPRSSTDRAMSCFFSASTPTYPAKVTLNIEPLTAPSLIVQLDQPASDDFDFSARFSEADQPWSPAPMSSADELFCNGQIRPLWNRSEDLAHFNSAQSEHTDDSDNGPFFFRSSADYNFTMFSLYQYSASAMNDTRDYVGYDFSSRYHDLDQACVHRPVCHVSKDDAIDKEYEVVESLPIQTSLRPDVEITAKHVVKVKVEECRGRRAGGGSIRRTRSLSPLRVFHMDDDVPRQLIDESQTLDCSKEGNGSAEQEEKWEGDEMARRKGGRLTLKELLHASEQAEQEVANQWLAHESGSKQHRRAYAEKKLNESTALWSKALPKHRLEDSTKVRNHALGAQSARSPCGLHYSSPRVSEQMRQQTFLPYRHGLLACLGFTSKKYRSVAGMRALHSKSQGMR